MKKFIKHNLTQLLPIIIILIPYVLFYLFINFFYVHFINNFININKSIIEKSLSRIAKDSKLQNYYEREINLFFAKIYETPEESKKLFKALSKKNKLYNINFFLFSATQNQAQNASIYTRRSKKYKSSISKIFTALYNADTNPDYKLPNNIKPFFRSYFGEIEFNDVLLSKGQLIKCNIFGNSSFFYWNTFQNTLESKNYSGIILFFEESNLNSLIPLKNLIKEHEMLENYSYSYNIYNAVTKKIIYKTKNYKLDLFDVNAALFTQNYIYNNNLLYVFYKLDKTYILIGIAQLPYYYNFIHKFILFLLIASTFTLITIIYYKSNFTLILLSSIKQKILLLFLATYIIPSIGFLLTGLLFSYAEYQLNRHDEISNMFYLIEIIDENFNSALKELDKIYKRFIKKVKDNLYRGEKIHEITKKLSDKNLLDQLFIVDSSGNILHKHNNRKDNVVIEKLIPYLSRKVLSKHNDSHQMVSNFKPSDYMLDSITENLEKLVLTSGRGKSIFAQLYEQTEKIQEITIGNDIHLVYISLIQDKISKKPIITFIITKKSTFGYAYLISILTKYNNITNSTKRNKKYNLIINKITNFKPVPKEFSKYNFTRIVHEKINTKKQSIVFDEEIIKEPYLIVSSTFTNIPNYYLIIATSSQDIKKNIYRFLFKMAIITILSLLFTLSIGYSLYQYIISPLNEINLGIQALENKNFNFQIKIYSNDEFSSLSNALNSLIKKMHELSIANIVQRSLLPHPNLKFESFEIACFYKPLQELAGDYYDFKIFQNQYIIFFIGDVTGYGIPAALVMAMVKTVIYSYLKQLDKENNLSNYLNKSQNNFPQNIILEIFNSVDFLLKNNFNSKLLITMFCGIIDIHQNILHFANAGHIYPIHYNSNIKDFKIINCPSFPLGTKINKTYKFDSLPIENNFTLILFTDGLIESIENFNAKSMYNIVFEILKSFKIKLDNLSANDLLQNCLNLYNSIYQLNNQKDDITLLIIKKINKD